MTTTLPIQLSTAPSLSSTPTIPPEARFRLWNKESRILLLSIPAILLGFYVGTMSLPTPGNYPFRPEVMSIADTKLSPISAFIRLEEQAGTNASPTVLEITPPDYVRDIPDNIRSLKALTRLVIRDQPLTHLPDSIGNLQNLQTLIIINTPLQALPETLGNIANLEDIEIVGTHLAKLPDSIGSLTRLKGLVLSHNRLRNLPPSFSQLQALVELDLTSNNFSTIPNELPAHLKFIFLGGNHIPIKDLVALDNAQVIIGVHF